jgi:hypothetical protein
MATVSAVGAGEAGAAIRFSSSGNTKLAVKKVTFSSSYSTGGEALTAADFGMVALAVVIPMPAGGYVFEYDYANAKLKAYRQKDPGNAGGADIPLPEVSAAVNISGSPTYCIAIGR